MYIAFLFYRLFLPLSSNYLCHCCSQMVTIATSDTRCWGNLTHIRWWKI
jgi:hypothetical protein